MAEQMIRQPPVLDFRRIVKRRHDAYRQLLVFLNKHLC